MESSKLLNPTVIEDLTGFNADYYDPTRALNHKDPDERLGGDLGCRGKRQQASLSLLLHVEALESQMTAKQSAFVGEYLVDLNASQAAIRAGYSPKTAYSLDHDSIILEMVRAG
jgi:hypothetical protein